ncbi:Apoptosis-inducing factor 1, mitochondrial [Trachymyrmex zeteki]|uniref:Apoptosis-inducing factor 1, mitochondrial n=1 Tax=Mycetomoellerius zeteki TaxID=64791 RepID=A0A151XIJ2_9HYME|nr:PREDICTED: apoptosis-inducing factor 1, mitochondrial [Trachymyrmex zeteki]KYQ60141.1 Apoptosis-inducing factor 1, mitochondrial [Trachymyrmex zeteki]
MFVYGRIVSQLPSRLTHVNHLYRPVKYAGVVNINNLRHNSDASNKKPHKPSGTTVKPEECVPESKYLKSQKTIPVCETGASCPAPQERCKPNSKQIQLNEKGSDFRKNGKYQFSYWHLVAALIVTGVAYKISSSFLKDDKTDQQKGQSKQKKEGRRHLRSKNKVKVPADSKLILKEVPYLLIGGGTAAFSAFRSIKSRDPKAKVLVIAQEEEFPYMRPPLSKELWYNTDRDTTAQLRFNQWNGTQRSIFYEPREFYSNVTNLTESDKGGVAVAMGWKVTKIDVINQIVTLDNGYEINYNKCLIATGASPKSLPIFESAEDSIKDKITTFRTKDNFLDLEENVSNPKCKNVVVIGGGFLGSELACALARSYKSKNIFQIYKEKFIMAQVLPEYLSEWTTKKAETEGVRTISNTEVQDYKYKNGRLSLVLTGGQTIDADQVIVAVGVQPNTDLATTSNLETDPKIGGFLVNAELEARSNLWVAGDAACFYDVKLGRRRVEHHDHAVTSGRLAGENMTGAGKPYLHQSMFWSDLGPDVGYEAIGIVDSSLPTVGVFAKTTGANAIPVNNPSDEQKTNSVVSQSNEKSESQIVKNNTEDNAEEEKKEVHGDKVKPEQSTKYKDFEKGVVFYLRDDVVVGIVLWNIFNRMSIARRVLAGNTKYDDLNEVAKLFTIHED